MESDPRDPKDRDQSGATTPEGEGDFVFEDLDGETDPFKGNLQDGWLVAGCGSGACTSGSSASGTSGTSSGSTGSGK